MLVPMNEITSANFGPLISYVAPGAVALVGISQFSPTLRVWFASTPENAPTIGGFLYLTVASIATGMTVSAVRWLLIDNLHRWTGVPSPRLNFKGLTNSVEAFSLLIDIHYRHYLFYANMFIATAIAYGCYRFKVGDIFSMGWLDAAFLGIEIVFFVTSRDTLTKYYRRSEQLLRVGVQSIHRKKSEKTNSLTSV